MNQYESRTRIVRGQRWMNCPSCGRLRVFHKDRMACCNMAWAVRSVLQSDPLVLGRRGVFAALVTRGKPFRGGVR